MQNPNRPMDKYHYLESDIAVGLGHGETFTVSVVVARPDPRNAKYPFVVVNGASKTHCTTAGQAAQTFIRLVGKASAQAAVRAATRAAIQAEGQAVQAADKAAEDRNEQALEGGNRALTREEAEDLALCESDYLRLP